MPYATQADLENAAGGPAQLLALADRDNTGGYDSGIIDGAIAHADSEINGYAKSRYAIPITPAPSNFRERAARIAVRYLRRGLGMLTAQDAIDEEADTKWLEALAKGLVHPDTTPTPEKSSLVIDKAGVRDDPPRDVSRERTKGLW